MQCFAANKKANVLFFLLPHAFGELFQMFGLCKLRQSLDPFVTASAYLVW